jgi:hypothetical protein
MKTIRKAVVFFFISLPFLVWAETKEIPFTLDDRDRIIRTEQKVEAIETLMKSRFEANETGMKSRFETVETGMKSRFETIDQRFDQLFNFLWAIVGIFTTMMISVFGFAFWDRKLSLAPMRKENTKILTALRDYAETQPKLREILKNAGLL